MRGGDATMKQFFSALMLMTLCLCVGTSICADEAKVPAGPYSTDFSKFQPGKPPEEFYLLNTQADFKIAEEAGNKFLELAGNPLDSFGVLYGPEGLVGGEMTAKIYGTTEGKLFPEFGLGVNDSGWKIWLIPGQNALVIRKRDDEKVRVVYTGWKSGAWTSFRMKLSKAADGKWQIQGKAWPADGKEPAEWMISTTD